MNKEQKAEEKRIKHDAYVLRERSIILRKEAVILCEEIESFADKYTDDVLDKLPWDEKERVMNFAESFEKKYAKNSKRLKILDSEFRNLIKRTNELYGREVIPEPESLGYLPETLEDDKEESNDRDEWSKPGDWWKME
jgi:hypothetical protein